MPEYKRLFFALWPDVPALQAIREASALLKDHRGRVIAAENLHLTLAFIGNADGKRQECLASAASQVRAKPFNIQLDCFGYFRKPQILWLGTRQCPSPLQRLVDELTVHLAECAYRPENPEYIPHVSLLRKAEILLDEVKVESISWQVDRFYLAESVSVEGGVAYQKLKTYLLRDSSSKESAARVDHVKS